MLIVYMCMREETKVVINKFTLNCPYLANVVYSFLTLNISTRTNQAHIVAARAFTKYFI